MLSIGHRGAMGHEPENTLRSVAKALTLGADWIEVDVYNAQDKLVVIHDDRLERTTDGTGRVVGQTLDYLRSLDAGKGEKIPFLEEVFAVVDHRAGINVELKGPGTAELTASFLTEQLAAGWAPEQLLVSSFDHHELLRFKHLLPLIRVGALIVGLPLDYAAFAERLGAYSIHPSIEFLDRAFVNDAHQRHLRVFVFTVNHPDDIRRMMDLGVDGVFSNYPERVIKLKQQSGESFFPTEA